MSNRASLAILATLFSFVVSGRMQTLCAAESTAAAQSQWVHFDNAGRLVYKTLPAGDRIMDFSSAGYMGGGVPLPTVPAKITLHPSGSNDTPALQQALDSLAREPLRGGFRGAVVLEKGIFNLEQTATLRASGIVLRGSGSGTTGTILRLAGKPHTGLSISGSGRVGRSGEPVRLTDAYVPSGAITFSVENPTPFKAGDAVLLSRPVTETWVKFMGMDTLLRNGKKETWLGQGSKLDFERTITAISGNRITLNVPLSDCLDAKFLQPAGATLTKIDTQARMSQAGIENLRIEAPAQVVGIDEPHFQAIRVNEVCDAWLRDIAIHDTVNSVGLGGGALRVTVQNVFIQHRAATKGAAKPADFGIGGSQILLDRCSVSGDNLFYVVTSGRVTGPNVVLNCVFRGNGHIQPHMRWATGLLVDGCAVPDSGIEFMNRGEMGSGHGWTMGWAVAWNCTAKSFIIQQPPGTANWAIGCRGAREQAGMPFGHEPKLPEGLFDCHDTPVAPASLYLAQLRERLGR